MVAQWQKGMVSIRMDDTFANAEQRVLVQGIELLPMPASYEIPLG
jgi:hypothetical protein